MSTKLFLRNTETHGLTPDGDTTWYDMVTTAGASADTAVVNTTASGTEIQFTKTAGGSTIAWISGRVPSGGFTLTTTDVDAWLHESNGQANVGGRYRVFKRASNGTITELAGGPFSDGAEPGTSAASMTWVGNVTDTAFAEDDRILVRFYITNVGTMGGNRTATLTFNAANAATGDSFFNIAETVAFKAESNPQTATPAPGDVTADGLAPTVTATNHQTASPGLGAATIAGLAPAVSVSTTVTADLGAATIAGLAPVVTASANVQANPALGAITADGLAPTVAATAHVTVTPAIGAGTLAGLVPVVTATAHVTATPDQGTATLDGLEPAATATAHVTATPDTGAAVIAGFAPIAEGGAGVTMTTGLGAAVQAGFAPTVETPVIVDVPVGSGLWAGLAPLVLTPVEVTAALGAITADGFAPTVTTAGVEALVTPGCGELVLDGFRPTVTASESAPPMLRLGAGRMSPADFADMLLGGRRPRRRR